MCPLKCNSTISHQFSLFHNTHTSVPHAAHLHHGQLGLGLKKHAQIPQRCLKCPHAFLDHSVPSYLLGVIKSIGFQMLGELLVWKFNTASEVWHNTVVKNSSNIKIFPHNYNTCASMP